MKRILSCFVLSFLLLFIASQLSYAEPKNPVHKMDTGFQDEGPFAMLPLMMPWDMGPMGEMPELRHLHRMHLQNLNLDEKQKETLKEIENSVTKELIRKRADEQIAEVELRELFEKDTVDLNAVETKLKRIATIKIETQLIFIKSIEKMKTKLTPEQREILKKIRSMDPRMGPPMKGDMMRDMTKMPPPSAKERGE
jgi:Spy/CpxP family protein refolding chaperone